MLRNKLPNHNKKKKSSNNIARRFQNLKSQVIAFLRRLINIIRINFMANIKRVLQRLRKLDIFTLLEPKQIVVNSAWLSLLEAQPDNHLRLTVIEETRINGPISIDDAQRKLQSDYQEIKKKSIAGIPIFGYHQVNPIINNVRSLFLAKLPDLFKAQIMSLGLISPFTVSTITPNDKNTIADSIVDLSPYKISIIGNVNAIINAIIIFGERLTYHISDPKIITRNLQEQFKKFFVTPVGSNLLWGGFGAIFAFEATFLFEKVFSTPNILSSEYLYFCIAIFSYVIYLVQVIINDKIFAFIPTWTFHPRLWSTFIFIAFIICSPLLLFDFIPASIIPPIVGFSSILLIVCNMPVCLGRIFFEAGVSKKMVIIFWLFLMFVIFLLYLFPK
jgi:hypothetical protein